MLAFKSSLTAVYFIVANMYEKEYIANRTLVLLTEETKLHFGRLETKANWLIDNFLSITGMGFYVVVLDVYLQPA